MQELNGAMLILVADLVATCHALAPSWSDLRSRVVATPTGRNLDGDILARTSGGGSPNTNALLRLFDAKDESDVRVTFYRDKAAWCPYCHKVWLLLEEKEIPYRVSKMPLNAYGDKPDWYTRKVDGGKLPAIELDGTMHTESVRIMEMLDATFAHHGPRMVPEQGSADAARTAECLELEKELMRDWFSLVFYPVDDDGGGLEAAREKLLGTLVRVDVALGATPGPWFLGGDQPSFIDLQCIPSVERMVASCLYWKDLRLRDNPRLPKLRQWLEAFETRASYIASKSDIYTLAMALPSQNGPGYFSDAALEMSSRLCGVGGGWDWPLDLNRHSSMVEPLPAEQLADGGAPARHEAAFAVITNHASVVRFACRAAGEPGRPAYHAELADTNAEPNESFSAQVDNALRHVVTALLDGTDMAFEAARADLRGLVECGPDGGPILADGWEEHVDLRGQAYFWNDETGETTYAAPTRQLDACLAYLRDRIGVPRDMSAAAALMLRAHLNWAIDITREHLGERVSKVE